MLIPFFAKSHRKSNMNIHLATYRYRINQAFCTTLGIQGRVFVHMHVCVSVCACVCVCVCVCVCIYKDFLLNVSVHFQDAIHMVSKYQHCFTRTTIIHSAG